MTTWYRPSTAALRAAGVPRGKRVWRREGDDLRRRPEEGRRVSGAVLACVVLAVAAVAAPAAAGASGERRGFDYDVPVLSDSPWPEMRRDGRNTAMSPIRARYRGDRPWSARTGRGIFSTPVIGGDETVYVGSADGWFYALGRGGRAAWRFGTGGIIDAAAALGRRNRAGRFPITIGSGDESLYQLRSGPRGLTRRERVRWRFRASQPPATGQLVNWWEGNVAYGPDGNLYVGNTGGGIYSLTPRRRAALGRPARQLGLDHAGVRRGRQQLLGLGRPLRVLARPRRRPAMADREPRLRHLVAGARLRRDRLLRLLRRQPARGRPRHRGGPLDLPDRRPHLQLAGARPRRPGPDERGLHRLGGRLRVRGAPRRQPALAL